MNHHNPADMPPSESALFLMLRRAYGMLPRNATLPRFEQLLDRFRTTASP